MFGITAKIAKMLLSTPSFKDTPLIWNTEAPFGLSLTPISNHFCECAKTSIEVKDETKVNKAIGIGRILHNVINVDENILVILMRILSHDDHRHPLLILVSDVSQNTWRSLKCF